MADDHLFCCSCQPRQLLLLQRTLWHVGRLPRLWTIYADGAYVDAWLCWLDYLRSAGLDHMSNWLMQFVRRTPDILGFQVLPKHWIVERTFG